MTTAQSGSVPIDPELMPLLLVMRNEANGEGLVLPDVPRRRCMARRLRRWARRAGVTRAELFGTDGTSKSLTFHDLRATGITRLVIRGDDHQKIRQWPGHEEFSTTLGYIRTAESNGDGFGAPFPPLPDTL
jgi:integrase